MKYFIKALMHELGSLLLVLIFLGIVVGLIALVVYVAGDYSTAVFLILAFVGVQGKILWDNARHLKRGKK